MQKILRQVKEMADAYQQKDLPGFLSHVSADYPYRNELEEFTKRDFRDYEVIRINLFIQRSVKTAEGATVRTDWQMQCFPTATSNSIEIIGRALQLA